VTLGASKACEIRRRIPVGEGENPSPTWLKRNQQASSDPACYLSNEVYEAGGNECAGRVIEPRNYHHCGHKDNRFARNGKADAVEIVEGNSPKRDKVRVPDTTGVGERGMHTQGKHGNLGEPLASL